MKTSNKILLTAFLTVIVLIAVVPLVIVAKYKRGDFVMLDPQQTEKGHTVSRALGNTRYICLTGVNNCTIIPSDSARIQILDNNPLPVKFRLAGDTLLINGDSVYREENMVAKFSSNQPVTLYLGETGRILLDRSHIYLHGSPDSAKALSYNIDAINSTVEIGVDEKKDGYSRYFDRLQINGQEQSTLLTKNNVAINELRVTLSGSAFNDQGSVLKTFKLSTDQQSVITLKKESIKKLQLIPNP